MSGPFNFIAAEHEQIQLLLVVAADVSGGQKRTQWLLVAPGVQAPPLPRGEFVHLSLADRMADHDVSIVRLTQARGD